MFMDIVPTLHPRNISHLMMVYDLPNVLLNFLCWYFIKDIFMHVHQKKMELQFVFSLVLLPDFEIRIILASLNHLGSLSASLSSWDSLRRVAVSSLKVWIIHLWNHSIQDFWLVGNFLITASVLLVVIGLFRFLHSSWFSFWRLYVCMDLSIFFRLPNLLAYNCNIFFACRPLHFCGVSCYYFSFIRSFSFGGVLFFFSWINLVKSLLTLVIFSKNQLLVSLIFCIFKDSILFIFALISIISFLLLTLGFVLFLLH